ncbi:hypothetical protein [Geothrix sp.]|jgi:hypothetical protein|uniref:hypothetical protein n=1 Tax=Geothrix sp. TaxID=1962974 RepID=UPI0025B879C5|nr:hypothetical protein [Geothrix sp.]
MTNPAPKLARLAQGMFIVSLLILAFGFAHLFSSSGNPSNQVIDRHMPYVYAFEATLGVSIVLAIVAAVLNFMARAK